MKKAFSILALIFLATCAVAQTNLGPIVTTSQDQIGTSTPPANPFSGNCRSYFNNNTGVITYINSIGGNCGPVAVAFPLTSAAQVQTGGSLFPSGTGQIASTQLLWTIGPPAPVFSSATQTGGSLNSGHGYSFRYTFLSALGETLAGGELQLSIPGGACVSGAACTISLTAITLPSGYTGYNTYMVDCGSGTCSGGELKLAACTNLASGVGCTATTTGSGALPTANTAYAVPSPTGANLCSPNTNPFLYGFDGTNWYPLSGIDGANTGATPPAPYAKLTFCRNIWFNDSATDPPLGKNSLALIYHLQNGVTTNKAVQDRGLFVYATNCQPTGNCSDSTSHYAFEAIQSEQDINGLPTMTGSPDGEVTDISGNTTIYTTAAYGGGSFGTNVIRASLFRQAVGYDTQNMAAVYAMFNNNNASTTGNQTAYAFRGQCLAGSTPNGLGCAILAGNFPNTAALYSNVIGLGQTFLQFINNAWSPRDGVDWLVGNYQQNFNSQMNGKVYLNAIQANVPTVTPVTASLGVTPSITVSQAAAIFAPSAVSCSGGASAYTYQFVGIDGNSGQVIGGSTGSGSTCTNPLTSGNPATITILPQSAANAALISQFQRIDVYRTSGPMGTGKIGSLTCAMVGELVGCLSFSDTGLTASGTTPSGNQTGSVNAVYYQTNTNCAAVGTAASPSVASCSGAAGGSFSCATNASGATCVVNTTAVTANSEILITQRTDTATGTRLGVTCNTTVSSVLPVITAVTAQTSFTINLGTVATNPECFSYSIIN